MILKNVLTAKIFSYFFPLSWTTGCDLLFTDETVTDHITFFSPNGPNEPSKSIGLPTNKTCSFHYLGKLYVQYFVFSWVWIELLSHEVKADWELTTGWSTNQLQILVRIENEQRLNYHYIAVEKVNVPWKIGQQIPLKNTFIYWWLSIF